MNADEESMGESMTARQPEPLRHHDQRDRRQSPRAWTDWYRFARDQLGLAHAERVEYANLRYVEEQNRASLRRRSTD
jgi:hypothetical protein